MSSTGGGGYAGSQGGYVASPTISSTVHEKQEFWIREEEGKETSIKFTDENFPVREGQEVWVAWGNRIGGKGTGRYLFAFNHASGHSCDFVKDWRSWLYRAGLLKKPLAYRLLTSWLWLALGLLLGFVWLPVFLAPIPTAGLPVGATPEQVLLRVTNPVFVIQNWPAAFAATISKSFGVMILVALATWLVIQAFAKMFGQILFLRRWEREQVAAIRARILDVCQSKT